MQLDADADAGGFGLGHALGVVSGQGEATGARLGRTFADVAVGELLVYADSSRRLALAVNQGNAAGRLGLSIGDEVRIEAR